jgi:hypothetical protein
VRKRPRYSKDNEADGWHWYGFHWPKWTCAYRIIWVRLSTLFGKVKCPFFFFFNDSLEDGLHTDEDTLKLLEYTPICLQGENALYQQASYATFVKRHLFAIQFVGYKLTLLTTFIGEDNMWTCLWQRTATIPSRWEEQMY